MSFLKITDPAKRDFIVEEYMKSKKTIQHNSLSEKLGDIGLQRELRKLYKPITETQSGTSRDIATALQALPSSLKAIQLPRYPSIKAYEDDPVQDVRTLELGEIAAKYLQQYASNRKLTDTTFGINARDGEFYIGDERLTIQGDDITVGDKTYTGTPGLWELLTMAKPNKSIYDGNDLQNYAEILNETNAMSQPDNPGKPKSSRSEKYKEVIKPIWNSKIAYGKGVSTVVIPQDPNELVNMLSLRMASLKAGNTGVQNEMIGILDELLRQGVIDKDYYKKINNIISIKC